MPRKLGRNTRRAGIALVLGIAASGTVIASAANLDVDGQTLGAGVDVIASCDIDGVTLSYTNAYQTGGAGIGTYRTTSVLVSGIDVGCAGKRLDLTLKDASSASLGTGTIMSIAGTSETVTMTPLADSNAVMGAAVVISDAAP